MVNGNQAIDSLWPSDVIWRRRSWSTLVRVRACCLSALSHHLNQWWRAIKKIWRSFHGNVYLNTHDIKSQVWLKMHTFEITATSHRGHWFSKNDGAVPPCIECHQAKMSCALIMITSSNGNIFRVTGPLCGEFSGHRWIPLTKASDAELWCFLWSAPESDLRLNKQLVKQS